MRKQLLFKSQNPLKKSLINNIIKKKGKTIQKTDDKVGTNICNCSHNQYKTYLQKACINEEKMTNHPTEKWMKDMNRLVEGKTLIPKRSSYQPLKE